MGRDKKNWGNKSDAQDGKKDEKDPRDSLDQWWMRPEEQTNARFENYYRDQAILPDPAELDEMLRVFRQPLPSTFRIAAGRDFTSQVEHHMSQHLLPACANIEYEGEKVTPPSPLPWYPHNLGWNLDVKKMVLRKQPEFKALHQWLVQETSSGMVSRQEAVSMIPPLFLNVQRDHLVLDLCAAPGSKTAQLLEAIHAPLLGPDGKIESAEFDPMPTGLVVANEIDTKRSNLLSHQTGRLPSANILVTNVDARNFPQLKAPYLEEGSGQVTYPDIRYDRILADVPCSGDGTLRKNALIWKDWKNTDGISLHPVQLDILVHSLELLADGGRMVYSTCSMNPVENEAVVAAGLREAAKHGFEVELVDTRADPEFAAFDVLKRASGLHSWRVTPLKDQPLKVRPTADGPKPSKVPDADEPPSKKPRVESSTTNGGYDLGDPLPWVNSFAELTSSQAKLMKPTMWPQGDEAELHLERCMRFYPHYQNTGAFFVAVLHKKNGHKGGMAHGIQRAAEHLDQHPESNEPSDKSIPFDKSLNPASLKEEPYVYIRHPNPDATALQQRYGLPDWFVRNMMVRNLEGDMGRILYATTSVVRGILTYGPPFEKAKHKYRQTVKMRLMTAGVHMFVRQASSASSAPDSGEVALQKWRALSEGTAILSQFMPRDRIIPASLAELRDLLKLMFPKIDDVEPPELRARIKALPIGSHLLHLQPALEPGALLEHEIYLPLWRAPASVNIMIEKAEKNILSSRVFGEVLFAK